MTPSFLRYELRDSYIHNWLIAGPQVIPMGERDTSENVAQEIAACYGQQEPGIAGSPVEWGKLIVPGPEGADVELTWQYKCTEEDHLVDLAGSYFPHHLLCAWAYTELVSPSARPARLVLHSFGPAQVWLNSCPVLRQEGFCAYLPNGLEGEVSFAEGPNRVLVRFEQLARDTAPYAIALRVIGNGKDEVTVRIPTFNKKAMKHQAIERVARKAYVERDLYAGEQELFVKWSTRIRHGRLLLVQVEKPSGHVIGGVQRKVWGDVSQRLLEATGAMDGEYRVRIYPEYDEYILGMRFSYDLDVNLLHSAHVEVPQGSQEERATELLQHAAWWTEGLYAEVARMALGWWSQLQEGPIRQAMEVADAQGEGCYELMIGLLLIAHRYASHESFPQELARRLEGCILGFDYERDDVDAYGGPLLAEDLAILRHACSVLAGQLYPDRPFTRSGQTGQWHQERGEERAMEWLSRRARGGFAAWNSGEAFQSMLPALIALVDYASSEALWELAAVIVDKLLFAVAANSFRGVLSCARGSTSAASITDGRMEPTSSISRLLWGVGSWNQHLAAAISLACSEHYEAPPLFQAIATDRPEELWARERHVIAWSGTNEAATPCQEVNTVTYKTPDYMLSSAQDHRPGEPGRDEHIWQATLSPEAIVFVNHPACMNQKRAYRPNFWRGNRVLPRVAQWRDLLIALYRLSEDDWLGYTHAHFPVTAFSQYVLRDGWAFGRVGEAYLALTASQGFSLVKSGSAAYRELRSPGRENVWLCQMGRTALDGSFADFQDKVLALSVAFDGLQVTCASLRGDVVTFDWTGPLLVNGAEQPLSGFKHYENPYSVCDLGAPKMEIQHGEWMLRLNLDMSEQ